MRRWQAAAGRRLRAISAGALSAALGDCSDHLNPIDNHILRYGMRGLTSLIHDGVVAGYSAPALLQWA